MAGLPGWLSSGLFCIALFKSWQAAAICGSTTGLLNATHWFYIHHTAPITINSIAIVLIFCFLLILGLVGGGVVVIILTLESWQYFACKIILSCAHHIIYPRSYMCLFSRGECRRSRYLYFIYQHVFYRM